MNPGRFQHMVVAWLALSASYSRAQTTPPSDNELRAAYCISVLSESTEDLRKAINPLRDSLDENLKAAFATLSQHLAEDEDRLNRLRLYMLPKKHLDPTALLAAANRGKTDNTRWSTEINSCMMGCRASTPADLSACTKRCYSGELYGRVFACRNLSWLPF